MFGICLQSMIFVISHSQIKRFMPVYLILYPEGLNMKKGFFLKFVSIFNINSFLE